MKAFSLKGGPAAKGFFGPNAQTLGSPFPPVINTQSFVRVDGGIFTADPVQDIAVANASNIAAITQGGQGAFSTNGGTSWTHIGALAGILTSANNIVANTAGTSLCCTGSTGATQNVLNSTNGGASWTDVTPVGSAIGNPPWILYSPTANRFFFFDSASAQVWYSSDGATWNSNAILVQLSPSPNFKAQSGYAADNGSVIVMSGLVAPTALRIYSSTDAITWTTRLNDAGVTVQGQSQVWDGARFAVGGVVGGITIVFTSVTGTGGWGAAAFGLTPTTPPYQTGIVAFGGALYSGFTSSDNRSIASSPTGVTWTPVPVSASNVTVGHALYPSGSDLYLIGDGIDQSTDGTTFSTGLTLTGGAITQMDVRNGHVLAVGKDATGNGGIWRHS